MNLDTRLLFVAQIVMQRLQWLVIHDHWTELYLRGFVVVVASEIASSDNCSLQNNKNMRSKNHIFTR